MQTQNVASIGKQLAKAYHRVGEAWANQGELLEAVKTYKAALATCVKFNISDEHSLPLKAALRVALDHLPNTWIANYWCGRVKVGEAPHQLSSRDGRYLKPVPLEYRIPGGTETFSAILEGALNKSFSLQIAAKGALCDAWSLGVPGGRAGMALCRAAVYITTGHAGQAIKDATVALVYGPQEPNPLAAHSDPWPSSEKRGEGPVPLPTRPCWAGALFLLSTAHECLGENVPAIYTAYRAYELWPDDTPSEYLEAIERLKRRVPEAVHEALKHGGSAGLEEYLAAEMEASKPEFLKKRPKYYYYYEWMRTRIETIMPGLPEPVMDKLLTMEANELDLLVSYPGAVIETASFLIGALEARGEEELSTLPVPLLSWEQMEAHKAAGSSQNLLLEHQPQLPMLKTVEEEEEETESVKTDQEDDERRD